MNLKSAFRSLVVVTALATGASSCATVHADLTEIVKKRAAYDMKCDAAKLELTPLSGGMNSSIPFAATNQKSYGVDGCGQRSSYYAYCTNMLGQESCEAMPTPAGMGAK
jgi:hypothetical protein